MASRSGTLPDSVRDGRTSMSGPVQGGYFPLVLNGSALLGAVTYIWRWMAPMDMRLLNVNAYAVTHGGNVQFTVQHNNVDVVATVDFPAADTSTNMTIDTDARDIAKGNDIEITIALDGNDSILHPTVFLMYYTRGHVNAEPVDD